MYGKSYDGVTGLIGIAQQPQGLAAVVAQEPVYDLYRYLYSNRVRFANSLATPALYDAIAGTPGTTGDDARLQPQRRSTTPRGRAARRSTGSTSSSDDHDSRLLAAPAT